jgi:hypothetical protein
MARRVYRNSDLFSAAVLGKLGANVATKHSAPQGDVRSRQPPPRGAGRGFSGSTAIAIEAIAA